MMAKKNSPTIITVPSYPSAGRPLTGEEWKFVQENIKNFKKTSMKDRKSNGKKEKV
tara:strand:- start:224 stop:391 length:168 start_codon:yes stop_codon:yes gene_type:complete